MRNLIECAAFALCFFAAGEAWSQVPTVDPTPPRSTRPSPPPTVGGVSGSANGAAPGAGLTNPEAGAAEEGAVGSDHLGDYLDGDLELQSEHDGRVKVSGGAMAATHTVVKGDTLWDISARYYNDPFKWPKVWSFNPQIKDPHWIYPGNIVNLRAAGDVDSGTPDPLPDLDSESGQPVAVSAPVARSKRRVSLHRLAFIDVEGLKAAATVDGSPHDKMMLSPGDEVYLKSSGAVEPGQMLTVYKEKTKVKHPKSGKVVGAYVDIVGELSVRAVPDGKRARATVLQAVDPIERGLRVGPLPKVFDTAKTKPAAQDLGGYIVAQLEADELIGARQAVIIDLGAKKGVEPGNKLFVVRSGDAYQPTMSPGSNVGQQDARYPSRAVGELVVVQVADSTALAIVTISLLEFGVGDRVLMRKGS